MTPDLLLKNIAIYERGIQSVTAIRERMLQRLDGASGDSRKRLQESLRQNEKALAALNDALKASRKAIRELPAYAKMRR